MDALATHRPIFFLSPVAVPEVLAKVNQFLCRGEFCLHWLSEDLSANETDCYEEQNVTKL